jgi:hypothetical protein
MNSIINAIADWFRQLLTDGIIANFTGMFAEVNSKVSEIAAQVGTTPQGWNASIFNLIRNLSETVVIPVAGMILTFVLCYELITMVIEKNNMADAVYCRWCLQHHLQFFYGLSQLRERSEGNRKPPAMQVEGESLDKSKKNPLMLE